MPVILLILYIHVPFSFCNERSGAEQTGMNMDGQDVQDDFHSLRRFTFVE
jgi:hypothetical protein